MRGARATTEARLRLPVERVLVVCYGNIYRSPFVAARLHDQLGERIELRSAGFHPREGRESPSEHVAMSRGFEVALDKHRSRLVTVDDLTWADTIVLMDRHNWTALHAMGAVPEKLVWLGTLEAGAAAEIPDPYGRRPAEAEQIVARLRRGADRLAERICLSRGP